MTAARTFLRDIRIEHTLFAMPFAYVGAVLAARGIPTAWEIGWIAVAVLGARTAAMAANRYFDREIDAANPRTARRALPSGTLPPAEMLWATVAGIALLVLGAAMLNPLCVKLLPLAALGAVAYPLCKRFTWTVHFVLGAVDACAPLGGYVAVAGRIDAPALLLFVAVTVWVAGFDLLYALMDLRFDREHAVRSFPVRFGERATRGWAIGLHLIMTGALLAAGLAAHAGPIYQLGVAAALGVTLYEQRLLATAPNLFVLNEKVFTANMLFSVAFLVTTVAAFVVPR